MNPLLFHFRDQHFWLSPERTIYWEEQKALLLSDLHFGKTGHFRKSGIAIPPSVFKEDLQRLFSQVQFFKPEQLIIAGDFSHSSHNLEMELFLKWRKDMPSLVVQLIKGNHDILEEEWYNNSGIIIHESCYALGNFEFVHDMKNVHEPSTMGQESRYQFSGHIHPGILISGMGKQSLKFPCFYFGKEHCVLPAFSKFTGLSLMEPTKHDAVFAIVENTVMKIV